MNSSQCSELQSAKTLGAYIVGIIIKCFATTIYKSVLDNLFFYKAIEHYYAPNKIWGII